MTRRIPDKDLEDGKDEFRAMLWMKELKATPVRVGMLEVLDKEAKPLSATEITKKLLSTKSITSKPTVPFNLATVYRTLENLMIKGLVNRTNTGKAHASYEMSFGKTHHHHATCLSCGLTEDVVNCDAQELNISAKAHLKNFKSIQSHSLEFFGLCKKCEEKSPRCHLCT